MHIYSKKKRQKKTAVIVILIALVYMQCWGAVEIKQYTFSVELNRKALEGLLDATVGGCGSGGGIDIAVTLAAQKKTIAMAAIIKKKGAESPLVDAIPREESLDYTDLNVGNRLYGGSWDDDYSSHEENWDDNKLCNAGELCVAAKVCDDEKLFDDEYVMVSLTIGALGEHNKNQ